MVSVWMDSNAVFLHTNLRDLQGREFETLYTKSRWYEVNAYLLY